MRLSEIKQERELKHHSERPLPPLSVGSPAVVGCADPELAPGLAMKRDGDRALLTCVRTGTTAYLTCRREERAWIGTVPDCEEGRNDNPLLHETRGSDITLGLRIRSSCDFHRFAQCMRCMRGQIFAKGHKTMSNTAFL